MNQEFVKRNCKKLIFMLLLFALAAVLYMTVGVKFGNQRLFEFSMRIRTPKLIAMMITAFAIGSASIVFQSIINNTIVTPCLLGMDALYTMIHTILVFILGSGSVLVINANYSFLIDLLIMGVTATIIYSYLFKKTKHNVLYVLLIGTVLTSLFSSIQSTMTRIMDPNEYDTLLTTLVASFSNVNSEIIILSVVVLAIVAIMLRKELQILDVLTLGKDQAINLGVDYDSSIRKLLLGVTIYSGCYSNGWTTGIFGINHCESIKTIASNLPALTANCWLGAIWNDHTNRWTDACRKCVCICHPCKYIYYAIWRNLFSLFIA